MDDMECPACKKMAKTSTDLLEHMLDYHAIVLGGTGWSVVKPMNHTYDWKKEAYIPYVELTIRGKNLVVYDTGKVVCWCGERLTDPHLWRKHIRHNGGLMFHIAEIILG